MAKIDLRTYVLIERAFIRRLQQSWARQSAQTYLAIAQACKDHKWDEARRLVSDLDMTEVGTENREWITYMLLSCAVFGASIVAKKTPSFVGVGTFDTLLKQVTNNFLMYLEHGATSQIQKEALQLIAEDETKSTVQKKEHKFGNTQIEIDPTSSAAASLNAARAAIKDEDLMAEGKDVDPNHVTVRYGLTDEEHDCLRKFIASQQPFEAQILGVKLFPPSEHSDGAVPVVARIGSPELRDIEAEIGKYAAFKEKSFPDYQPHCTLAYCKPDKAKQYKDLYVDGSFVVRGITISHKTGVMETLPFGMTKKADPATGRYVTPFVSFDHGGDAQLQLIASLNASRLATWGFTAEMEVRGMARYRITAVLDGRTSEFCRIINGKIFQVADAREKVIEVLNVQNPDDLKVVQPWPKQSKAALAEYSGMSASELTDRGLHIPPYHPGCRTLLKPIESSAGDSKELTPTVPAQTETFQAVTANDLKEMGVEATPEQVDQWNQYIGMSPVELISKLTDMRPQDVMMKGVGPRPIVFDPLGNIAMQAKGVSLQDVSFKLGTLLDPFTGTYYLTRAQLTAGTPTAETKFLRNVFLSMIDMGLKSSATSLAVGVAGNAPYYAKLGFLPDVLEWNAIRKYAGSGLDGGDLQAVVASLAPEDQLLVKHLLQDQSQTALSALVDLPFVYQGKTIGEWILQDISGTWALDLTDNMVVEQAKAYLS